MVKILFIMFQGWATNLKHWNEYTLKARGIIFDSETGECIALPFKKFFNVNETQNTLIGNLPQEPFEVFDKLDGSLGISYWHKVLFILQPVGVSQVNKHK